MSKDQPTPSPSPLPWDAECLGHARSALRMLVEAAPRETKDVRGLWLELALDELERRMGQASPRTTMTEAFIAGYDAGFSDRDLECEYKADEAWGRFAVRTGAVKVDEPRTEQGSPARSFAGPYIVTPRSQRFVAGDLVRVAPGDWPQAVWKCIEADAKSCVLKNPVNGETGSFAQGDVGLSLALPTAKATSRPLAIGDAVRLAHTGKIIGWTGAATAPGARWADVEPALKAQYKGGYMTRSTHHESELVRVEEVKKK